MLAVDPFPVVSNVHSQRGHGILPPLWDAHRRSNSGMIPSIWRGQFDLFVVVHLSIQVVVSPMGCIQFVTVSSAMPEYVLSCQDVKSRKTEKVRLNAD